MTTRHYGCLAAFFIVMSIYSAQGQDTVAQKPVVPSNSISHTVTRLGNQADSLLTALQAVPAKYVTKIDDKISTYSNRINNKTEQTLAKLTKWEGKIKSLLEKASPETAQKLFGPGQATFGSLLQKVREGKAVADGYKAKYNAYRDQLTTSLSYLQEQKDKLDKKLVAPLNKATTQLNALEQDMANAEAVEAFIKERKKQLLNEAVKYIGKSKYLKKIDKEAYYYVETLRNYKEIFSNPKKAEETALAILNKIPAFKSFIERNSMLASLFPRNANMGTVQALAGLQTRADVQALVGTRLAAGGPNAQQVLSQNIQAAQIQLNQLKDRVLKAGGTNSDTEIPSFTPNKQKSKTFKQRLEYSSNIQFVKVNSLMPATADIAFSIGYKLNDKSIIGIGANYKVGFGKIQRISITHQGIGFRSYLDWKLKKQFFVSGGMELNHFAGFKNIEQLKNFNAWQTAGLVGISKKIEIKTKLFKGTKLQVFYDVFYASHVPISQPFIFRIGRVF